MAVASLPNMEKPSRLWTYDEMVAELEGFAINVKEMFTAP